jgi:UDP-N-acetylmuramate: L-alanyl-gamma-D-glutamyl-meso-diaminopimelate ligase
LYAPPDLGWDAAAALASLGGKASVARDTQLIVEAVAREVQPGDQVLVMSNGGFEGIHQRLLDALAH